MNLHCSQTPGLPETVYILFDIPMNLHCSQTMLRFQKVEFWFDIPMNLHCSQTQVVAYIPRESLIFL